MWLVVQIVFRGGGEVLPWLSILVLGKVLLLLLLFIFNVEGSGAT